MNDKHDDIKNNSNSETDLNLEATIGSQYYSFTANDWRTQTLEDLLACPLCGSNLEFKASTNFSQNMVHEDAHCPTCQIKTKQNLHRLQ